jgi:hypothetical protein
MRCREIVTDFKYEVKGKSYYGNFLIIEEELEITMQSVYNRIDDDCESLINKTYDI